MTDSTRAPPPKTEPDVPTEKLHGTLSKLADKGLLTRWKSRWFQLVDLQRDGGDSRYRLAYYSSDPQTSSSKASLGTIDLDVVKQVRSESWVSSDSEDRRGRVLAEQRWRFSITVPNRVYHFAASDMDTMWMWIDGLNERCPNSVDLDCTELFNAVRGSDAGVVDRLLESGKFKSRHKDKGGQTALHVAGASGGPHIIETLLKGDPDLHKATDRTGWTALHVAAHSGQVVNCRALVKAGANCAALTGDQNAPLHYFVRYAACSADGDSPESHTVYQVLNEMVVSGGWVNQENCNGDTPLHTAASRGQQELVSLLMMHDADPDIKNKMQETPLFVACRGGHATVVYTLLFEGHSQLDIKNQEGLTAREVSQKHGQTDVVKIIDAYSKQQQGFAASKATLRTIFSSISSVTSCLVLGIVLLLVALQCAYMATELRRISGGMPVPDLALGAEDFNTFLAALNADGRRFYFFFEAFDSIYMFLFFLFASVSIHLLLSISPLIDLQSWWWSLRWAPLFVLLLNSMENFSVWVMLLTYPSPSTFFAPVAWLSSYAKFVAWMATLFAVCLGLMSNVVGMTLGRSKGKLKSA